MTAAAPIDYATAHRRCGRMINYLTLGILKRWRRTADPNTWADCQQAGRIALMLAARRYDPARGARFSTYAGKMIRCLVLDHLCADTLIRVPQSYRRTPRGRVLLSYRGWPEADLDAIPDPRLDLAQIDEREATARAVANLLDTLKDRERTVIVARYGLDGGEPETLGQVGRRLGVTRERVRQIELRAIARMREVAA